MYQYTRKSIGHQFDSGRSDYFLHAATPLHRASTVHSICRPLARLLTCSPAHLHAIHRLSDLLALSLSLSCMQTGQPMLKRSKLGVCEPVPVCSLFCSVRIVEAFNGRGHRGRSIGRATQRRLWCAHDSKEQRAKSKEQRAAGSERRADGGRLTAENRELRVES